MFLGTYVPKTNFLSFQILQAIDGQNVRNMQQGERWMKVMQRRFHLKLRVADKPVWESSDSANVVVKASHCFYRSNLQTTVKELRQLNLSAAHMDAIKATPFWFLVISVMNGDEDTLSDITKKHEEHIRSILKCFDHVDMIFRFRETT